LAFLNPKLVPELVVLLDPWSNADTIFSLNSTRLSSSSSSTACESFNGTKVGLGSCKSTGFSSLQQKLQNIVFYSFYYTSIKAIIREDVHYDMQDVQFTAPFRVSKTLLQVSINAKGKKSSKTITLAFVSFRLEPWKSALLSTVRNRVDLHFNLAYWSNFFSIL